MTKRKQPPIECRLRPNYTKKCIACGHGPVVDVYTRDGHFVNSTSMCGACSFGKEKYADPENWELIVPESPNSFLPLRMKDAMTHAAMASFICS